MYATLASTKCWLGLSVTDTKFDRELYTIIAGVEKDIDLNLRNYTSLPVSVETACCLADISAEWSAGVFRQRRASSIEQKDQPFITDAKGRLKQLLEVLFKHVAGFDKTDVD